MKPSSFKSFAMDSLILDSGTRVKSCCTIKALRILTSMSAIGSLTDIYKILFVLPARLSDSRYLTVQGHLAETDAAEPELAYVAARSPTFLAAVAELHLELGSALPFQNLGQFCHLFTLA